MLLWLNFFVFRFQIISSWDTVNTASGLILRTFREKLCHRVIYEYFCMKKLQNVVEIVHNNVQKVLINSLHSNFWKRFIKMWFFFRLKTLTPPLRINRSVCMVQNCAVCLPISWATSLGSSCFTYLCCNPELLQWE